MLSVSSELQSIASRLEAALAASRESDAAQLAAYLAQSRCRVRVCADPEASSFDGSGGGGGGAPLPEDSVLVCLTFQAARGLEQHLSRPVRLPMPRTACVADLKSEALMAFDLPIEVQRCIVNGKLPREETTLGELLAEAGDSKSVLQVRTYLVTRNRSQWPPDPEKLRRLKEAVRTERLSRQRQSEADEGSAGSVERQPEEAEEEVEAVRPDRMWRRD